MSARLRLVSLLAVWLFPAALELAGCNDGSTGCKTICPECACGDFCISCAMRCTSPKGGACAPTPPLAEPLSLEPLSRDGGGAD
jgi:hypothetical protein